MAARHEILGGKVQIYKRGNVYHCSASVAGRQYRSSTKKDTYDEAEEIAEQWYLSLRGEFKRGELGELTPRKPREKTFRDAAEAFLREFPVITEGQRSPVYMKGHGTRFRVHLLPFFGDLALSEISAGTIADYRIHRVEKAKARWGKPPARNTIHQEMVCLRQALKCALRHKWLSALPDMSEPYKANTKISHRAWFSPVEYRQLYQATQRRAKKPLNNRYRYGAQQLHDMVLFMANTGLRPDEVLRLEYRDVAIVDDEGSGETILEIEVRGKRGVGFCKSTANAVPVFNRLVKRNKPKPGDRVFPKSSHMMFKRILNEEKLLVDREGQRRTLYSLRHTYICFRLMEGADIYQIAKNCRTSVEMIEKFYASHIKTSIDAKAINVRKARPAKRQVEDVMRAELKLKF